MLGYGFPDIEGFYDQLYGTAGIDLQSFTCFQFSEAASMVFPGNPPFTVTDFIGIYAKFVGPPTVISGTLTAGSNTITGIASTAGIQVGQLVVNLDSIPKDSTVTYVGTNSITISNTAMGNDTSFTAYLSPIMPLIVILTYITLARASIMCNRYKEAWFMMMCYYVAHFCTLFLRTDAGDQNYTASSTASSGLTKGIAISRSAGDVSTTSKILESYDEWGAWRETQYGELFITVARSVNAGPIWVR